MGAKAASESARSPAALRLDDFAALKVSGSGRRDFLQGQLSQDLEQVRPEQAAPAAWCNRQGRVLCLMVAVEWNDATFLLLPAEMAETCAAGLGRYILRARVRMEKADEPMFGCADADRWFPDLQTAPWACLSAPGYCVVRLPGANRRALLLGEPPATVKEASDSHWTPERWRQADIEAQLPWVGAGASGKFLAHSLNLDLSGAVSFTKGCYVGQEIIARMEYRGTPKRRMQRVRLPAGAGARAGARVAHPELGTITVISAASAGDWIETLAEVRLAPDRGHD